MPGRAPPPPLVTDQATLETHCQAFREAGRFAFDTEFIRDETFDAILCLIQATSGEGVVLIDPTVGLDLAPFWDLLHDPDVTAIVHAGKEDFEVCLTATGSPPRNIFDVQIAAGFVGYGYPLNLVRLVDQVTGKTVSKGQTLTDWLRRPLTDRQLRYAVDDVAYLPAVHRKLSARLEKLGRATWAREEFDRFESPDFYRPPARERFFKLKGARRLDSLGLMVLERLIEWRDEWARKHNRPVRAMMRDDVLVEIARQRPTQEHDLSVMRGFPQARNVKVVRTVLEIIEQARSVPKEQWPVPPEIREHSQMTKAVIDLLSAYMRAACYEAGVSQDLVGAAQRLRELVDYLADRNGDASAAAAASASAADAGDVPILMTGWRRQFIGRDLADLLEGRTELHLSGWPAEPRLEVVNTPAADA